MSQSYTIPRPRRAKEFSAISGPFELAHSLVSEVRITDLLDVALEDGDPKPIANGLRDIFHARFTSQLAKVAGRDWESVCQALSTGRAIALATFVKVLKA